jgi:hypothetical protein
MYRLESSTDFRSDLSPLELGDTRSRAQSGSTRCQPRCQTTSWRSLADAADMVSAVLDVVGRMCRGHPSVRPRLPNGRRRLPTRRPDYYSDETGRWLAERLDLRPGRKVVDIAAGTDKLTRALVATAARSSRSSRWRACGSGWLRR